MLSMNRELELCSLSLWMIRRTTTAYPTALFCNQIMEAKYSGH